MTSSHALPSVAAFPALEALLRDRALAKIFAALDAGETRVVGGAVRDALLGREVHEIDLATTLVPEAVVACAESAGIRCVPTGLAHGTVTLVVEGRGFEVTTLREDVETDGRHAKVRFGRDFAADAGRRDFTMNALYFGSDGRLYDPVGGLADLADRRVRFIGDPSRRIREDYLRILRFFRFSAAYGEGPLDPAGLHAAILERGGLARLSRERIHAELRKLLVARRAVEVVEIMSGTGLLGPLLGSVPNCARLRRVAEIEAGEPPDAVLRLAALCVRVTEDADRLRALLRLSNLEHRRLAGAAAAAIALYGHEDPPEPGALPALLYRFGRDATCDALALCGAETREPGPEDWAKARAAARDMAIPHLPIAGADVIAKGVASGRGVGMILAEVEARWAAAGFPEDKALVLGMLDHAVTGKAPRSCGADSVA